MLLRFTTSNFLSFKEQTEFNTLTGDLRRFDNHVFKLKDLSLLKFSAIYGANATGKSNLIRAIDYLRDAVIEEDLGKLDLSPFKGNENKPSSFEIEFVVEDEIYLYGIQIHKDKVVSEYLYFSGIGSKDILIFDRVVEAKGKSSIEVNKKYLKPKKSQTLIEHYQEKISAHQLFLNIIADIDLGKLSLDIDRVLHYMFKLQIIFPNSRPTRLVSNLINEQAFMEFCTDMLCSFDTGIKNLSIQEFTLKDYFGEEKKELVDDITEDLQNNEGDDIYLSTDMIATLKNGSPIIKKLYVEHVGFGSDNLFSFNEESDGTKRLIEFMSMLYGLVVNTDQNDVFIIDEIGRSIHPHLLKNFLEKLSSEKSINGQLIFTTHESNLLDLNVLRADEIWFAEKNRDEGFTEFKTLSEFKKIRPDLNIRKGYFDGRFGGIPILANFEDLNWSEYASN